MGQKDFPADVQLGQRTLVQRSPLSPLEKERKTDFSWSNSHGAFLQMFCFGGFLVQFGVIPATLGSVWRLSLLVLRRIHVGGHV